MRGATVVSVARLRVGGDHAGAGDEPRPARTERLGREGVHDLHVPRLVEPGELLRRQGVEGHLLVPGLGVGADQDLPVRDLGQDPEAEGQRLPEKPARASGAGGLAAEHRRNRPQPEDGLDDG
jgi:hypothetical protein